MIEHHQSSKNPMVVLYLRDDEGKKLLYRVITEAKRMGKLIEDMLSLSPLGFNSLIKTLIGFLYGYIQGRVVIDVIVMPVLFVIVGTMIKLFLSWIVSLVFSITNVHIYFFHLNTVIEIAYNAVLTPFIFGLLNRFKILRAGETEKI